jgi:hypothetical protein
MATSLSEACIRFKFLALPNPTKRLMRGEDGGFFPEVWLNEVMQMAFHA